MLISLRACNFKTKYWCEPPTLRRLYEIEIQAIYSKIIEGTDSIDSSLNQMFISKYNYQKPSQRNS
jgi:hypothetical protein